MNASYPDRETGLPDPASTIPTARNRSSRRALRLVALIGASVALFGAWGSPAFSSPASERATQASTSTQTDAALPTIVFVHGAWADNGGFALSIDALQQRGYHVVSAANPLRDLIPDADYVADTIASIEGPIVLVGHSYGGAVISNAATGNENVTALVYINGWVPDEGESLLQLAQLNPGSLIPEALVPVPVSGPNGTTVVDLYLAQDKFREAFAGDVPERVAAVMAATQRPFTETAFGAASGPVAWRDIPSWYLLGTEDKAIPPATQRFMAERANADITEVPTSHVSMITAPKATTKIILEAVKATTAANAH